VMKDHYPVTDTKFCNIVTDGSYYPRGLMAENAGCGVGSGGDFFEVGAADTAGMNPNQDLASPNLRDRNSLQPYLVDAPIYRRCHGRGDPLLPDSAKLCRDRHSEIALRLKPGARSALEVRSSTPQLDVPLPGTGSQKLLACWPLTG